MQANEFVTINVPDSVVIVDGQAYHFPFTPLANIWAIHWDAVAGSGEVEYADGRPNIQIDSSVMVDGVLSELDAYLASIPPSPLHVLVDGVWTLDLAGLKTTKMAEIMADYHAACTGSVDCTAGGVVFTMDAGEDHARRMFAGYNLAQGLFDLGQGPATMTITDYNNNDHLDVPLTDAYEIALQQGTHFAIQRQKKNDLRRQINAVQIPAGGTLAAAQTELDAITW